MFEMQLFSMKCFVLLTFIATLLKNITKHPNKQRLCIYHISNIQIWDYALFSISYNLQQIESHCQTDEVHNTFCLGQVLLIRQLYNTF